MCFCCGLADYFSRIGAKPGTGGIAQLGEYKSTHTYTFSPLYNANNTSFIECDLIPTLPDLTFVFSGKNYTLAPSEYILNMGGQCMSAIQGMDINVPGGDLWIIGDAFLRKYFTVYDMEREAVGFAVSA